MPNFGIIAIVGMPGSGKSTLTQALGEQHKLKTITAGDVARRLAETDKETQAALKRGEFAPKERMNAEMRKTVGLACIDRETIVIEGYPRYADQLSDLKYVADHDPIHFIILHCNDGLATKRLLERGRAIDDNETAIKQRLIGFWTETYPIFAEFSHLAHHVPIGDKQHAVNNVTVYLKSQSLI